jgi:hypothetical protein
VAAGAIGCHGGLGGADAAGDSTFVGAIADLRRAVLPGGAETTRDSAGRAAVRDSILRKYHVTTEALEDIARRLALNPDHAAEVLRAVDRRVQIAMGTIPAKPTNGVPPVGHAPLSLPPGVSTTAQPNPAPSNADARALLNSLNSRSTPPTRRLPPSAGAAPRP